MRSLEDILARLGVHLGKGERGPVLAQSQKWILYRHLHMADAVERSENMS